MSGSGDAVAAAAFGNQVEFARAQGWQKSYVTALKKEGRLVFTDDGRVDFAASLQRIKDTTGAPERAAPAVQGEQYSTAIELGRFYDNEMKRLEYERAVGKVRDAAEVAAVLEDVAAVFRTSVEAWTTRMAPDLAALNGDEGRIRALLRSEGEQLLRKVAQRMARLAEGQAA